jgi:hypothetical protein
MKRSTGPEGQLQTWNAAGIAIEGLLVIWFEQDPTVVVSAGLGQWTTWNSPAWRSATHSTNKIDARASRLRCPKVTSMCDVLDAHRPRNRQRQQGVILVAQAIIVVGNLQQPVGIGGYLELADQAIRAKPLDLFGD